MNSPTPRPPSPIPLWPLPLIAGLLPAVGSLIALAYSIHLQLIPACNPFIDGCVSVSRAARYDLSNHIFRAMTLSGAALQGLTWILVAHWLRPIAPKHQRSLRFVPWLGLIAAIALIAYGTFLGTEGQAYRWLRAYGTVIYFGFTCIAMILAGGAIREAAGGKRIAVPLRSDVALLGFAGALLALGIANAILGPMFDAQMKDKIENITEWWGSLIFTLVFMAIAAVWRRNRVSASMTAMR